MRRPRQFPVPAQDTGYKCARHRELPGPNRLAERSAGRVETAMLRIEVDVFSGRPNPVVTLSGREADEALERLAPAERIKRGGLRRVPESMLGYRGLIIEHDTDRGRPPRLRYLPRGPIGAQVSPKWGK